MRDATISSYGILPEDSAVVQFFEHTVGDIFIANNRAIHVVSRVVYEFLHEYGFADWPDDQQERALLGLG